MPTKISWWLHYFQTFGRVSDCHWHFYSLFEAFHGRNDKAKELPGKVKYPAICGQRCNNLKKKSVTGQKQYPKPAWWKQSRNTLHTMGALSFKTCHRTFSLENAVSLTSSHATEPCCITMTQECPSLSRKSPHSNNSLGEGKAQKRGGGRAECGGKQKGTRLPLVTAHPQPNTRKSITCRIKRKRVHKVKTQWKQYPPI